MKIAMLQLNSVWEKPRENYAAAAQLIKQARSSGCDIAVLPEMFATGTSTNTAVTAEPDNGPTEAFLAGVAREQALHLIAGYALQDETGGRARNVAAVYNRQGDRIARYAKLHLFSPAREDQHYAAGAAPVTFELEGAACGIFICYDLRFPEAFRSIAKKVQAIFIIANWPQPRIEHWQVLLRARAIENQCFIIGVNRTGIDGNGLYYPGRSCIFDPWGTQICRGGDRDVMVSAEIHPQEADRYRAKYKFLNDMRPR